jgi:hypothetical protein
MQVLYMYPCCISCSEAGPVSEETAGSIQCKYCTCIPAVLVAARLVQLLKKLQVPYKASIVPVSLLCYTVVAARLVQLLKKRQVPYNASIVPVSLLY